MTRPNILLHLAWVASGTPGYRDHADNDAWATATTFLAQECRSKVIWFIATGSTAELDDQDASAYAKAKRAAWFGVSNGVESGTSTCLRPHYVFDPRLRRPAVMLEIQNARAEHRPPVLAHPEQAHDFIHVADVASAIRAVLTCGLRGVISIGSGRTRTVADLVRASEAEISTPSAEAITMGRAADVPDLHSVGWRPEQTEEYFNG